jgi:hypothetical protein
MGDGMGRETYESLHESPGQDVAPRPIPMDEQAVQQRIAHAHSAFNVEALLDRSWGPKRPPIIVVVAVLSNYGGG